MKMFRERDPLPMGIGLIVAVLLVVGAVLNINSIIGVFGRHYSAILAEAGGLKQGDPVRVSGLNVGRVSDVNLASKGVQVDFTINNDNVELGSQTTAAVEVATVLGDKALVLTSVGSGSLSSTIPMSRTRSAFDVSEALSDLTQKTTQIDVGQLSKALNTVSTTVSGVTPEFRSAITGIGRLSETIGSRDATLRALLAHASAFSKVLAQRSDDMAAVVHDGNLLFAEVLSRRNDINTLLSNVSSMSLQLSSLVDKNQKVIGPALKQLDGVIGILQDNKSNLDKSLRGLAVYATGLGEVVGSGQFFTAYLQNLIPGNMFPPTIKLGKAGK